MALILAASQARLGHLNGARYTMKDFKASVSGIDTMSDVKQWIDHSAEFAGFEPLYEGLRLCRHARLRPFLYIGKSTVADRVVRCVWTNRIWARGLATFPTTPQAITYILGAFRRQ